MDTLCCLAECVGMCLFCRWLQNRNNPNPQPLCGGSGQSQQTNGQQYGASGPGRQQQWDVPVAPVARGPARYDRTSNVLGSRDSAEKPSAGSGAGAGVGGSGVVGGSSRAANAMPSGHGYRLGDQQNDVPVNSSSSSSHAGRNAAAPPTYDMATAQNGQHSAQTGVNGATPNGTFASIQSVSSAPPSFRPQGSELTLAEQVEVMSVASVTLIKKMLAGVLTNDPKRRRVKMSNEKVRAQILQTAGALDILRSAGFVQEVSEGEDYLVWQSNTSQEAVKNALQHLNTVRPDAVVS